MGLRERRNIRRFTLVEILVVLAILALLMGLGIGGYGLAMDKAKRSKTETLIKKLEVALETVKNKHGYYPQSMLNNQIIIPKNPATPAAEDLACFQDDSVVLATFAKAIDYESFKNSNTKTIKISGNDYYVIVDAWGNPLYYSCPGTKNTGTFDILSAGSDGKIYGTVGSVTAQDNVELWDPATPTQKSSNAEPNNTNPKLSNDIANF